MTYDEIEVTLQGNVCLITLDRPQQLNAYTPDMGEQLVHALRAAAVDDGISAAVITGKGKGFCAGADLEYLKGRTSRGGKRLGEEEFIAGFTEEFAALPLLTIAAINGAAAGIGITGMLAADIRLAATDAKLVLNFAELGIMPALGSTYFLPRLVGESTAKQLLLSQRRLCGGEAASLGLVNEALPAEQLLPRAMEIARGAQGCKPGMITAIKQGLALGARVGLGEALAGEKRLGDEVRS